jgi:signal transduction histidine kinase
MPGCDSPNKIPSIVAPGKTQHGCAARVRVSVAAGFRKREPAVRNQKAPEECPMTAVLRELAAYLQSHEDEIISRWKRACERDDALELVSRLTRSQFRNNIPAALGALYRTLVEGKAEAASDEALNEVAKHGHHRWKQGFNLQQVTRDWGKLNQVIVGMVDEFFLSNAEGDDATRALAFDRVAEFMTEAACSSVRRYDDLRKAEAASLEGDLKLMSEEFSRLTKARTEILREAAHDIRGGLSAVAMAFDLLKTSSAPEPNESFATVVEMLDRGIESVSKMLNSLLDLSRLESGSDPVRLLSVDIADVLVHLAAEHRATAERRGLGLRTDGSDELLVRTDTEKVRRLAQNLLVNALQHTTHGEVSLSWHGDESEWVLCVSDTGPGIQQLTGSPVAQDLDDPDEADGPSRLKPSNSYRGEGIGLAIVKKLADLLDAGVFMESEAGRGTTFIVRFPLGYDA